MVGAAVGAFQPGKSELGHGDDGQAALIVLEVAPERRQALARVRVRLGIEALGQAHMVDPSAPKSTGGDPQTRDIRLDQLGRRSLSCVDEGAGGVSRCGLHC